MNFFRRVIRANLEKKVNQNKILALKLLTTKTDLIPIQFPDTQTIRQSDIVHYDLGNELFTHMLDSSMTYTCGYWKDAQTLEQAQFAKLDMVCKKLMLEPGMTLLDMAVGFGALAKHAAKNYGVSVTGITLSQKQREYALQNCAGLPVEIHFQDYRNVQEKFDRIASIGMFEAVRTFKFQNLYEKWYDAASTRMASSYCIPWAQTGRLFMAMLG